MPLLCLHYRNLGKATQKLQMSGTYIPAGQKLRLVGYTCNTKSGDVPNVTYNCPDHILVSIDEITTQECNIASPPTTSQGNEYISTHAIPLPLSNNENTIQFGMSPLEFTLSKPIQKHLTIKIQKYDNNHNIVDMDTVINHANDIGNCRIEHLLLYFQYNHVGR